MISYINKCDDLFISISWATVKCQTFELGAGQSVMGTQECGRQKNNVWYVNQLYSQSHLHI